MSLDMSWLQQGLPLFGFALVVFVVYAILAKTKVLGGSKWIDSIVSLIIGIILLTFSSVRTYLLNVTPWFALLLILVFFFLLLITFTAKNWESFTKPLAIVFIILLALVLIAGIFYTFPKTRALLPGDRDYYDDEYRNYDYFDEQDCYKKTGYWKCYLDNGGCNKDDYETYDKCVHSGSDRLKCYDYDDYEHRYGYTYDYRDEENIFIRARNWIYRDKITNAFWLIVIAIVAMIILIKAG